MLYVSNLDQKKFMVLKDKESELDFIELKCFNNFYLELFNMPRKLIDTNREFENESRIEETITEFIEEAKKEYVKNRNRFLNSNNRISFGLTYYKRTCHLAMRVREVYSGEWEQEHLCILKGRPQELNLDTREKEIVKEIAELTEKEKAFLKKIIAESNIYLDILNL